MADIVQLSPNDLTLTRGLNAMFGTEFDDAESYAANPPSDTYLIDLLARPNVIALAAVEDSRVIGGLVAYDLPKFEQARSEVYIYDLAVSEDRRRRGIATALINRLQQIAAERGAWVVYIQADYGDEPAIALYTKFGIREDVIHFDLPVAPKDKP